MPQRYSWIQRRSRNAAAGSSTESSPMPDGDASSQCAINNSSPTKALTNPNLDLSTALVPPSRGDENFDTILERQESHSPNYMIASSRSSLYSQKSRSPSFRKQYRRFIDDDEEGSSVYFISEPSLSEDCRSVEYSNSPTNDLYLDQAGEGIMRPYFSPMQLVRKRASKSPISGNDSLHDSTEELTSSGFKLHTMPSSKFERESSSSSDEELEKFLPSEQDLGMHSIVDGSDVDKDVSQLQGRRNTTGGIYHRSNNHHRRKSSADGSELHEHDEPTQLMKTDFGQHSSYPQTHEKKGGTFHRWSFSNIESKEMNKILHPKAVRSPLHLEQPLTSSVLPQISSDERIGMAQSLSDSFVASSSNWVRAPYSDGRENSNSVRLASGIIPDSDSTSTLSSPDSACSRSSSPFSWISNKKKVNDTLSDKLLTSPAIPTEEGRLEEKDPVILNSIKKKKAHDIPNATSNTRGSFPRQSSASHFSLFKTQVSEDEAKKFPTFVCPRCKTRQREFFTVATVPGQFESPAGYLAIYFAIYVIASLYIFGLEVRVISIIFLVKYFID